MSSTFPPDGPPEGQQPGQPGPEYLEQGRGGPLPTEPATSGAGLRKGLIAGGAILGLAVVGGGVWAAASFLGQGPQPAEALPASTIGYASVDLDPSGSQKIEAIQMLRKFPAFKEEIGLETDDDIKEKLFDEIEVDEQCDGLDYADDIEPWLGDRMAMAAVDTGEKEPTVIGVVQVKDADAAEDGFTKLAECGGGSNNTGWAINGDWALIADSDDIAEAVADEAAEGSLADDDTYQRWTDEVGDAGVVNMYAAPEAGKLLAENLEGMPNPFGAIAGVDSPAYSSDMEMSFDDEYMTEEFPTDEDFPAEPAVPEELTKALEDFEGMAATLRFDDGALEFEVAGDPGVAGDLGAIYDTEGGDDMIATLPENTAAAVGVGFADGWFSKVLDQVASYSGGEVSVEDLIAEAEAATGLDLPDDAETLTGDSAALAISADIDPEALMNSDSPVGLPIGVKVQGEPDDIEGVLDKIRSQMGPEGDELVSESQDDVIAIGADEAYVSELEGGDLGDSDAFKNVIREADQASAIFFLNFDAGDGWLAELAGDDKMAKENLEPLEGLGLSAWQEDDAAHGVLRLTTN